jgi:hypothetical protein
MHRTIAAVIDIGACHALVDDDDGDDLASYTARVATLMNDAAVKTLIGKGKCPWNAQRLRKLMLEEADIGIVKNAVFDVLDSNLTYEAKLALLKCETAPVGESVAVHVAEAQFNTALKLYQEANPDTTLGNDFSYNVVAADREKFEAAYKKLSKNLTLLKQLDIRNAQIKAMHEARYSRLPAMHVAALSGKAKLVVGYIEMVAGFISEYTEQEIVSFLEVSKDGISLFNNVMRNGASEDIKACMTAILDTELSAAAKLALINARTRPFNTGAFYLLMSCGQKEEAMAFVKTVLQANQIDAKSRVQLLRCEKRKPSEPVEVSTAVRKELNECADTARAEALRKHHNALVDAFDQAVEQSDQLAPGQKAALKTT